jgi:transposase
LTGPSPVDRSRLGSKHHVICCAHGLPLAHTLTAATATTSPSCLSWSIASARSARTGSSGPRAVVADRAYDSRRHRAELRARAIRPKIAKRKTAHGSGLGVERWVIERTFSWLHNHRRLARRYDRRADIHEAFLTIACALICHAHLKRTQTSFR